MTNLESIKADILENWNIRNDTLLKRLTERGLDPNSVYTIENSKLVNLAFADLLMIMANNPNVSEGRYSQNWPSPKELKDSASVIYSKYGVANPLASTARFISNG